MMDKKAILVLEDGCIYEGHSFGAETTTYGEVVFSTSMAGYQEMLTDPSFAGQILVPLIPSSATTALTTPILSQSKYRYEAL